MCSNLPQENPRMFLLDRVFAPCGDTEIREWGGMGSSGWNAVHRLAQLEPTWKMDWGRETLGPDNLRANNTAEEMVVMMSDVLKSEIE